MAWSLEEAGPQGSVLPDIDAFHQVCARLIRHAVTEWAKRSRKKHPVGRVIAFFEVRVTQFRKICFEFAGFVVGYLDAHQNPAIVGSVVSVMEQADVPVVSDRFDEVE